MAEIRYATGPSWLGTVLVARSDRGIAAILPGDDPGNLALDLARRFPTTPLRFDPAGLRSLVAEVVAHIEAPAHPLISPIDLVGTPFQLGVWDALRTIPPGATVTYAGLAATLGRPTATRAVAGACASNRHAVVVPCHRVIRADGGLSGYRWGVDRKARLLARERTAG